VAPRHGEADEPASRHGILHRGGPRRPGVPLAPDLHPPAHMSKILTGTYRTRESAIRAAGRLIDAGFTRDEVCLLAPDDPGAHFVVKTKHETMAGIGGGALIGLVIGALAGVLLAMAAITIPTIGIVTGGPLVSALIGAGAGATVGGLIGALVGVTRVHHETMVVNGHELGFTLVGVSAPRNMAKSAEELLHIAGATKITRD